MNIYCKIDNKLEQVGTVEKFIYDNEVFYKVCRLGMFDCVYNEYDFKEFKSTTNFIIK